MKVMNLSLAILILFVFNLVSNSIAQNPASCSNVNNYYIKHIPYLFSQQKTDSITTCIRLWDEQSIANEELTRLKILWAIKNGTFREDLYDHQIISQLLQYRQKILLEENIAVLTDIQKEIKKYQFSDHRFNRFTRTLAYSLLSENSAADQLASLFTQFYSTQFDSLFLKLNEDKYRNSKLFSYYELYTHDLRQSYTKLLSITTGFWLPLGKLSNYDPHPMLGIMTGFKRNKTAMYINVILRFWAGNDKIMIRDRKDWYASHFLRSYFYSLEGQHDILHKKYSEFSIGAGIGLEHFQLDFPYDDEPEYDTESILANIYFSYTHFWLHNLSRFSTVQFGLIRYGGFWENGQYALSLRTSFGISINSTKNNLLKYLHY